MSLPEGLYDSVLTHRLEAAVSRLVAPHEAKSAEIPPEQIAERLTEALSKQLASALDGIDGSAEDRPRLQLELINSLLVNVRERLNKPEDLFEAISDPPQILRTVHRMDCEPSAPETGLAVPWLF